MPFFKQQIQMRRLGWFIHLRWAAVSGGCVILLCGPLFGPLNLEYGRLVLCVAALGFLNAAYWVYLKKLESRAPSETVPVDKARLFLHLQMIADLALLTAMLYFSGGVKNPLILFYLFHMAISAILFTQKESLFYATLALALPWILYFLERTGFTMADPWKGISGFSPDYESFLLWAYSAAVAGFWFFLSRLSLDLEAKEQALRESGEKLKTANEALKQLDVYKNRFLKQVVFQLKSPAIEMDLDLSAVESAIPEKNEKVLAAVQTAKKRIWILLELVEDLAWLSRVQAEEGTIQKAWLNVYEILLRRIQAVENQARLKGVTFQLHGDSQSRLLADPESFEKVADNLFSNAVKYTPAGNTHVVVNFKPEGNWFILTVEDEGIGIPTKQQKKLFQEFFRATNAKAVEKFGTGLGLSVVKQVMDRHAGRVTLSSGPHKGTKVETWWPLAPYNKFPSSD